MEIKIIAVGKMPKEYLSLVEPLVRNCNFDIKIEEIILKGKFPANITKEKEGEMILKRISPSVIIPLDLSGKQYKSESFAKKLQEFATNSQKVTFIIGGAFGLSKDVLAKANMKLCLSEMTLPHMLARLMLVEQIYRASAILSGHPYHK